MALPGFGDPPVANLPRPLLEAARRRSPEAEAQLREAWSRFGATLPEPAARHGLDTALILAELGLDTDTLAAGLLLPAVEAEELSPGDIAEDLSPTVAGLVSGAERMGSLGDYRYEANAGERADPTQIERARKLLIALAEDARVLLIRLAERLALMRRLRTRPPEARADIAGECLEVYAPLAGRLGIRHFKSELEDLAFRELDAQTYINIARPPRRAPRGPRAIRRKGDARTRGSASRAGRHGRGERPPEAYLQHLAEDEGEGFELRAGLRPARPARARRRCRRLLHRARRRAFTLATHPQGVRRLRRHPQAQPLPVPAHCIDRPRGQDPRSPDPHPRDARARGVRGGRPLAGATRRARRGGTATSTRASSG